MWVFNSVFVDKQALISVCKVPSWSMIDEELVIEHHASTQQRKGKVLGAHYWVFAHKFKVVMKVRGEWA